MNHGRVADRSNTSSRRAAQVLCRIKTIRAQHAARAARLGDFSVEDERNIDLALESVGLAEDMLGAVNRHLERKGLLRRSSNVDATTIAAPSSTKNQDGERDPEMHQTKNGNQWHFGMKAHIAVDADSGLVQTVTTTAVNECDVEPIADLLHGMEQHVWANSGYRGAQRRVEREDLQWQITARPRDIAKLPEGRAKRRLQKLEHGKASVRAKVEHPFRVIKRQFGLMKVRVRGPAKNTAHVVTLFALSNLWMARRQLVAMAVIRPNRV